MVAIVPTYFDDPGEVSVSVRFSGSASVPDQISTPIDGAPTFASVTVSWIVLEQEYDGLLNLIVPANGCGVPCTHEETGLSHAEFAPCAWTR